MQIQTATFDWAKAKMKETRVLSQEDLFDPAINIEYGCIIYHLLFEEFGDETTAIAAYHAGWGITKKWLADPQYSPDGKVLQTTPYDSTNLYISRIEETQKVYRKLYQFDE